MSRYEDYHAVSRAYDETRSPIGTGILRGCLTAAGRPLPDIRLLDAGCGTGAYSQAMLPHVGHIDAVDLNEGMLSVARAKMADDEASGHIAFHLGSIDALPFADETFDAALINQVLHHLDLSRRDDLAIPTRDLLDGGKVRPDQRHDHQQQRQPDDGTSAGGRLHEDG